MKTLLAGLLLTECLLMSASMAAPSASVHTEDWCADSIDFAMRSAQRREEGTPKPKLAAEIHTHLLVFQQQYPTLAEREMQRWVDAVYQHRWSRFAAAVGASKACGAVRSTAEWSAPAASADGLVQ